MVMDYLENIGQLLAIMVALLISLFRYIGSRRRRWLYAVVFYLGSLLSTYFWTAYLIIMGDDPNVSDFLAYFGWNVAFLSMMILTIHLKTEEERRYIHPLMFLPIPINVCQFFLYIQFGGILNSLYQVTVLTVTVCFALQGILWYLKKKDEGAEVPHIAGAVLLYSIFEFGMWTSSCFGGWQGLLYFPCSFLASATLLLLVWAIEQSLAENSRETGVIIDHRIQNILKTAYFVIVVICSAGGILLGIWIKNILRNGMDSGSAYDIIPIILFLVSTIIAAAATAVIFIVYFEQKVAENQKLREDRTIAEQSNAAKSEFLAQMSHEIRTPINAVLGMNEMVLHESMKAKSNLPEGEENIKKVFADIMGYAGNIDSAGNNLLSIINDILDFSKIEAGKLEIRENRYELSSVLNDVSNMIAFRAQGKGLEYIVDVEEDLPDAMYGDEVRIRQVITNVLNNAVKYTKRGSVTMSVKGDRTHGYEAGKDTELIVTVTDTGIGIKEEDLDKLFNKFERMDMMQNSTVEGTGLGLAISKQLLEMMNGSIEVRSYYGKGSEFIIRLPQRVESTEPIGNFKEKFEKSMREKWAVEAVFTAPDARILIVDDTRMNLIVAAGLLKDIKCRTDMADSGIEALRMTSLTKYDVILLDQRMPKMDGIETLQHMREQEGGHNQGTPVICLTADAIAGAKARYISAGFTDYLTKPIDSRALKNMIMKYLPDEMIRIAAPKAKKAAAGAVTEKTGAEEKGKKSMPEGSFEDILLKGGIDPEKGMKFAQNDSGLYMMLLQEYANSAAEKKKKLTDCYDSRKMKDYSTYAHSLKSTSRTIGAEELGDIAARMEKASDVEDWDAVTAEHAAMMEQYDKVTVALQDALKLKDSGAKDDKDEEIMEFLPK
jgi:signal transduction histidine kinase/DNA-binding NarL/FixJ family response regulator/HPt (histidine-containing phosphotransfer) domain-containing protein